MARMISVLTALLALSRPTFTAARIATYLPISYSIPYGKEECLYERITEPNEHLTASVFVLNGEELRAAMVFEGPVAPVDLDVYSAKKKAGRNGSGGHELTQYTNRYDREGVKMFVKGKYGDNMMNVKPVRIAELVDFEEEEEDYFDDYEMTEEEREDFNAHHDLEHRHMEPPPLPERLPPKHPPLPEHHGEGGHHDHHGRRQEAEVDDRQGSGSGSGDGGEYEEEWYDDDHIRARNEMREAHIEKVMEMEAEMDDDFVKLQMEDHRRHQGGPDVIHDEEQRVEKGENLEEGEAPRRRKIVTPNNHRRLREEDHNEVKLLAGEPYQRTIQVQSPGWYRLCVHPRSHEIDVEMELRKSSTYGKLDPRTGHVPRLEDVETHDEIHHLYESEDDARILAEEEGALKDEDLKATKEQLRILQRVYADIVNKQLEERRMWNWRTIKNQHIHSHLVLGNLVETVVYMGITGLQVYTIRKWFSGGAALG